MELIEVITSKEDLNRAYKLIGQVSSVMFGFTNGLIAKL